jgi:hypothetical protein
MFTGEIALAPALLKLLQKRVDSVPERPRVRGLFAKTITNLAK